jgi:hypothetical protein
VIEEMDVAAGPDHAEDRRIRRRTSEVALELLDRPENQRSRWTREQASSLMAVAEARARFEVAKEARRG